MSTFPTPDQLDYDRLIHNIKQIKTHQSRGYNRATGITTAYAYLMLGDIELGDVGNRYVYVGINHNEARRVMEGMADLISRVYGSDKITVNLSRLKITVISTNVVFRFVGYAEFVDRYRLGPFGEKIERIFLDVMNHPMMSYRQTDVDAMWRYVYADNPNLDVI